MDENKDLSQKWISSFSDWNDKEETSQHLRQEVNFKEFSPLRSERAYIFDALNFIQDYCPSDAVVTLNITENIDYFATLNIQSSSGHFFEQQENICLYELMDSLTASIFDQINSKKKRSFFTRKMFPNSPTKAA